MSLPSHTPTPRHLSLRQLQRVRQRLLLQRADHPIEYGAWDAVLTLWIMGWTGWLPAFALDALWAFPLCLLAILAPRLYLQARARAHDAGWLRCDWLAQLG